MIPHARGSTLVLACGHLNAFHAHTARELEASRSSRWLSAERAWQNKSSTKSAQEKHHEFKNMRAAADRRDACHCERRRCAAHHEIENEEVCEGGQHRLNACRPAATGRRT